MTDINSSLTPREFLEITAQVYEENKEEYIDAKKNPKLINYLVGKMMVKSKGEINPVLATAVVKAIVTSDIQSNFKINTGKDKK